MNTPPNTTPNNHKDTEASLKRLCATLVDFCDEAKLLLLELRAIQPVQVPFDEQRKPQ